VHNVHAYILGEHGDSEFAAWSMTHIAGMHIDEYCPVCGKCDAWRKQRQNIEKEVRESAYHIINYKGATHFAVGLALVRIAGAILRGQNTILTTSTLLEGEWGIRDVCLSVPCVISEAGVSKILTHSIPENEITALTRSAGILQKAIRLLTLSG
jgi:L-lactate dehydrogenase